MKTIKINISILLTLCLVITGLVFTMPKVSAATGPPPADWAFEESSRPLNDAIFAEYPALGDANGYVTIPLANSKTGTLDLGNKGISSTMNGIENFTNISQLLLTKNKLTGDIPADIGSLTNLTVLSLSENMLNSEIPSSIGDLSNLVSLYLYDAKITGEVPSSIAGLTSLRECHLGNNNLSGDIDNVIDNLSNSPDLYYLDLSSNKFGGEVPVSVGDILGLQTLYLSNNQLTGQIPSSIGSLSALKNLYLSNNQLTGEIPASLYTLPNLENLRVQNNSELTGNPATGFSSSTKLNYLNIKGTSLIQASPEIPTLGYTVGTFLYDDLAADLLAGAKTTLADGVTQDTIDKAQESANAITDTAIQQQWQDDIDLAQQMLDAKTTVDGLLNSAGDNLSPGITESDIDDAQNLVTALPDGSLKDELQAKIDTARDMLDAKDKTDGLLTTDGANLKPGVDKGKVDEAQEAVNKLPNGELKDELQSKIDTARDLLDAEKKVGGLIGPDGKLKPGVDKGKIDEAQAAVNKLPDGDTKDRLQSVIDEAYKLLKATNGGNGGTTNGGDSKSNPKSSKSTPVGGSVTHAKSVSTGDSSNYMIYALLLALSLSAITYMAYRRIAKNK